MLFDMMNEYWFQLITQEYSKHNGEYEANEENEKRR
jgi:hypothetical protein